MNLNLMGSKPPTIKKKWVQMLPGPNNHRSRAVHLGSFPVSNEFRQLT